MAPALCGGGVGFAPARRPRWKIVRQWNRSRRRILEKNFSESIFIVKEMLGATFPTIHKVIHFSPCASVLECVRLAAALDKRY